MSQVTSAKNHVLEREKKNCVVRLSKFILVKKPYLKYTIPENRVNFLCNTEKRTNNKVNPHMISGRESPFLDLFLLSFAVVFGLLLGLLPVQEFQRKHHEDGNS